MKSSLNNDNEAFKNALHSTLKAQGKRRRQTLAAVASTASPTRRNDLLPRLSIEQIAPGDLSNLPRNVRRRDEAHVREVAASIAALGFCVPVLVGSGNSIVDGAISVAAAMQLALPSIPCIRVDHLTPAEQRLLRVAVNRLSEKGEWDLDELKIEFEELNLVDAPIEISGFTGAEIDQIILGEDATTVERGPLSPAAGESAVSEIGDVFILGDHRVLCGDATDPQVLSRLMGDDGAARLILTDEPYNVKIAGNVTRSGHREFAMASGEMSPAQYLEFNVAWMRAALEHLVDGGLFGSFIDWRGLPTVQTAAAQLGLTQINLIVWAKPNAGMGSLYRSAHELLPLYKKGRGDHVNNVELGRKGRWRSNVWTYPGASSFASDARRGLENHPTVKPTAMLADALLDVTARGDIVLDPFLGSGSTLIAAQKTGRRCRGVEIDRRYVDVILRRFQAETGLEAILEASAEPFSQLASRRLSERSA